MIMQCLGEVAMVCLSAMKLREESWDAEASRYGLSLHQASEDAVAEALREHPPEVQKAVVGLVHLMITSWNDTEGWATSIMDFMANININSQTAVECGAKETYYAHRKSAQPDGSNSPLSTEGEQGTEITQSVPETDEQDVPAAVSSADGSIHPDVHASMVDTGGGFAYVRNCA